MFAQAENEGKHNIRSPHLILDNNIYHWCKFEDSTWTSWEICFKTLAPDKEMDTVILIPKLHLQVRKGLTIILCNSWHTVNVVIYAGGKFRENVRKTLNSYEGYFHDTTHIFFIEPYGFCIHAGEILGKKAIPGKMRKLPTHENVHVYSITHTTCTYI